MTMTILELHRKQSAALLTLQRELTSENPDISKVQIAIDLFEEVKANLALRLKD